MIGTGDIFPVLKGRGAPLFRGILSTFLIFCLLSPIMPWEAQGATSVLGGVEIEERGVWTEITLRFNLLLQYRKHSPLESGDLVDIQLLPVRRDTSIKEGIRSRQRIIREPTRALPLSTIFFEEIIPGKPELILRFTEPVKFEIRQGSDLRFLTIRVRRIGKKGEKEVELPGPEKLSKDMMEGKRALAKNRYEKAVKIFSRLNGYPEHRYSREALELLGVARERDGQFALAREAYQRYLSKYPDGEDARRIRQRLSGIMTAGEKPKLRLRKAKKIKERGGWKKQAYGSISQFYNRDVSATEVDGVMINQSLLSSDLDFTFRGRSPEYETGVLIIGDYEKDFEDRSADELEFSEINIFGVNRKYGHRVTIGRQSYSKGGVLGRFDGGLLTFQFHPLIKITGEIGYPVNDASLGVESDRYFFGGNIDFGTFGESLDINLFFLEQRVAGVIDRRAAGGEIRIFRPSFSLFTLVDYDVYYGELNTLLLVGNFIFPDKTTLNLNLDYRMSPLLSTTNALSGQQVSNLRTLLSTTSRSGVESLARDRTSTGGSFLLGLTHPLGEKLQISGDVTLSRINGTPASGGVDAVPGTGNEFFYNLQLIGNNLMKERDIAIMGLRFQDLNGSKALGFRVNIRFPLINSFRINPILDFEFRRDDALSRERFSTRPSLRLEVFIKRMLTLEVEGGAELTNETLNNQNDSTKGYFLTVGYRFDF